MRYLIYARVSPRGSTWAASETSIPDQVAECEAYVLARDRDAQIRSVTEEFVSGKLEKQVALRAELTAMRADCADWDTLVFRDLDRAGRSALDILNLASELQTHGKSMLIVQFPFPMEPPFGSLILGILAFLAQFERDMISRRTRQRMVGIAQNGGVASGPDASRLLPPSQARQHSVCRRARGPEGPRSVQRLRRWRSPT